MRIYNACPHYLDRFIETDEAPFRPVSCTSETMKINSDPGQREGRVPFTFPVCVPVPDSWIRLFPKVWLLLALYVFGGRSYWPRICIKPAVAAAGLITAIAALDAERRFLSYQKGL